MYGKFVWELGFCVGKSTVKIDRKETLIRHIPKVMDLASLRVSAFERLHDANPFNFFIICCLQRSEELFNRFL